jgi:hypothetical protein
MAGNWAPVELWLDAQCVRWVSVKKQNHIEDTSYEEKHHERASVWCIYLQGRLREDNGTAELCLESRG